MATTGTTERMAELVVVLSLLFVAQNVVSLCDFGKLFFRFRVGWFHVRMKLPRKLLIRLADFVLCGSPGNTEHFVEIAF